MSQEFLRQLTLVKRRSFRLRTEFEALLECASDKEKQYQISKSLADLDQLIEETSERIKSCS